jgi:hypothetical protein
MGPIEIYDTHPQVALNMLAASKIRAETSSGLATSNGWEIVVFLPQI